ncbi:hypothetical protein LZG74_16855 [Dyadobacter sp. CY327]|uniref:hypothetical protein n=1 Tax=Dyadobacter sp. CY327 TaxID=2907301 RepID=UPI001F357842|nr:hypothetical protein [Dyadobacter sp. CY327]MCE7071988.1 hypothetical protein [Dyadobacter sp. CY327]
MKHLTPYEMNLMRSGYNKRLEDERELGRFQAWTNYVTLVSINGGTPAGFDEWMNPKSSSDDETGHESAKSKSLAIKKARKISAKKKAALEAQMNAIP